MNAGRATEPAVRFFAKVAKGDGCWLWTGATHRNGYGSFKLRGGRQVRAHRFSWELARGPVPDGLSVLHRCDNRRCVRPEHLFVGTQRENLSDMVAKGRSATCGPRWHHTASETACPNGHPREGNTRYKAGHPVCRICVNEQSKAWRNRKVVAPPT